MTTFEIIAFIIGCITIFFIGIVISTILLYAISALIAFIALCLKLNPKSTPKIIIQLLGYFGNKSKNTNPSTNAGWPTQYIKYVISHYLQIVWGKRVVEVFKCLAKSENSSGNRKSDYDVINFAPVPLNNKQLDGIHNKNLAQDEKAVNQNGTIPKGW